MDRLQHLQLYVYIWARIYLQRVGLTDVQNFCVLLILLRLLLIKTQEYCTHKIVALTTDVFIWNVAANGSNPNMR